MTDCEVCGETFKHSPAKARKYCSVACYRVAQRRGDYMHTRCKMVPCDTCGTMHPPSSVTKRDGSPCDHKFCSWACYQKHYRKRVEWTCIGCGETSMRTPGFASRRKYCSHDCKVASRRVQSRPCSVCGVQFTPIAVRGSYIIGIDSRKTCSDECLREFYRTDEERKRKIGDAFRGANHWNWEGGKSFLDRNWRGPDWAQIAERARERDGRRCTKCGTTAEENGRELSVHHIEPFHNFVSIRKANRMSNLTTLCRSCHREVEHTVRTKQMLIPLSA